jgi:dienelactone hydrolase
MHNRWIRLLSLFFVSFSLSTAWADDGWKSDVVRNTFDNRDFSYREKPLAERPGYRILRLQYPSPLTTAVEQNNTVPADYYLPDGIRPGDAKRPAVICLHILDGNEPLTDLLCSALAVRGIPAIAFKLPYYGERGLPEGPMAIAKNPKLLADTLEQTNLDVRRTVDLLASRPEIDASKIGISGISLGGIIAASAAGRDSRLNKTAILLGGGDVLSIIHSAKETKPLSRTIKTLPAEERNTLEAKIKEADPLRAAPGLRDRALAGRVLMINATDDEVIPKKNTEKLADALAIPDKIVWLDGLGHYTAAAELPFALKMTTDFFARDLPQGAALPSDASRGEAIKKFAEVLRQAAALFSMRPEKGKCHAVDVQFSLPTAKIPMQGSLDFSRGGEKQFALTGKFSQFGDYSFGQCEYPWYVENGEVLAGTENPATALLGVREIMTARYENGFRMLSGMLQSCSATPEVLLRYITVENHDSRDGKSGIAIVGRDSLAAKLEIDFEQDGRTVSEMRFSVGDIKVTIHWMIDGSIQPHSFDPPGKMSVKSVDQKEVYGRFRALLTMVSLISAG